MVGRPVDDTALRMLYAEARAQYDLHPSDYLEGVLTGLSQVLDETAQMPTPRHQEQAANATHRSTKARVRDYQLGMIATLKWAAGGQDKPPVHEVLTNQTDDPGDPAGAVRPRHAS